MAQRRPSRNIGAEQRRGTLYIQVTYAIDDHIVRLKEQKQVDQSCLFLA
jgi:hypothetical protein